MAETKARFLANLIGADNTANDFTLPNTAVSGTNDKVLTSGGDGTVTWKTTVTPPVITSITTPASDNSINEDTNVTMTINGSNFSNTMNVSLVDATNESSTVTGHGNLGIASFVSSTQITVNTVAGTTGNAITNSNVKVKLDKSGLTATSSSISVSPDPAFSAPSSNGTTLASVIETTEGNVEVVGASGIVASSGSDAITYVLDQTSTNANNTWQFNTSTGVVTSPTAGVYDVPSGTSYTEPFTVTATAGGDSSRTDSRTFNIIVHKIPAGSGTAFSGHNDTTQSGYIFYPFTTVGTGTFTTYMTHTIDIIVIGGGGGGGKWGGCGGGASSIYERTNYSLSAGTYTVTVGGGGAKSATNNVSGDNGANSKFVPSSGGNSENFIGFGGGGGGTAGSPANDGGCGGGEDSDQGTAGDVAGKGIKDDRSGVGSFVAGDTVNQENLTQDHIDNSHAHSSLVMPIANGNGGGGAGAGFSNGKYNSSANPPFDEWDGSSTSTNSQEGQWGGGGKLISWAQHGYGTNVDGLETGTSRGYFGAGGIGLLATSQNVFGGFTGNTSAPYANSGAGGNGDNQDGASGIVLIRLHL